MVTIRPSTECASRLTVRHLILGTLQWDVACVMYIVTKECGKKYNRIVPGTATSPAQGSFHVSNLQKHLFVTLLSLIQSRWIFINQELFWET